MASTRASSCYVRNPLTCFTNIWGWKVSNAFPKPRGDRRHVAEKNTRCSDEIDVTDETELAPCSAGRACARSIAASRSAEATAAAAAYTPNTYTGACGWKVGDEDVLVISVFVLVLMVSWLLRAYLVSKAYNSIVPRMVPDAFHMSLGAGMALVGLVILLVT